MSSGSKSEWPWLQKYIDSPGAPEPFAREFNAMKAEIARMRGTLEAKERAQRANEDEMGAENKRLREALEKIVARSDWRDPHNVATHAAIHSYALAALNLREATDE